MDLIAQLARELNLKAANVEAAVKLIDEGNTIPFISRYRKEATGGMDDVALRALDERLSYLRNLEQRKEDVILLIDAQGKLTPELEQQIREATQLQRVEDLYKPYRKKRMTRAQKAREAGLEPLANMIIMQASAKGSALDAAADYVNEEAGFDTPEKALVGAADIVAETVAEDPENVADLRAFTQNTADIVVEATDPTEKTPYEPYYNFDEPLRRIPNHRVLAIDRGEREENGAFTDRRQLKKVPKLGPKAYLNAAGFLRISGGKNPLDATSVHPESYEVATAVLERAGVAANELSRGGVPDIERRLGSISALASNLDCGTLTLIDIVNELKKPGRDPRDDAPEVVFSRSALSIDDLEPGMELKGTVRNVVDFGAFVDVGVHQDGLVHISKLANRFVKHPSDVVRVGDTVKVWVEKVDRDRKKISLTMVQGK